jgi:hypothetical protein
LPFAIYPERVANAITFSNSRIGGKNKKIPA